MKKIGFIDSGIGGFSLLQEIFEHKVELEAFYICDRENVPYGGKEQDFMLKRTRVMVERLIDKKVDAILLACNTLTVETINALRKEYPIPFIGIEPYVKYPLIDEDLNHKYGLILTPATFSSQRFQFLKSEFDKENKVVAIPLPNLALNIESAFKNSDPSVWYGIKNELNEIKHHRFSKLILGCTHYPLITEIIEKELDLECIDPHKNVIKQLVKVAELKGGEVLTPIHVSYNIGESWNQLSKEDLYINF